MGTAPVTNDNAEGPRVPPPSDGDDRRCVACGYMLRGLGPEPRCPECGLLNVTDEFRREVWALVDSGKWFFSGFLHPFRKRPPGWWWALDRQGDVRRSWRFAGINLLLSLAIVAAIVGIADGWVAETRWIQIMIVPPGQHGPPFVYRSRGHATSLLASRSYLLPAEIRPPSFDVVAAANTTFVPYTTWRWQASWASRRPVFLATGLVWLTWMYPTFVGITTQIRRGLPSFARAPRTITAAANYESHRLIYSGAVLSAIVVVAGWRAQSVVQWAPGRVWEPPLILALPLLFAACGWIGPLRSDYTRQLVRSRKHAARIVVMYVLVFPVPTLACLDLVLQAFGFFA